MTTLQPSFQPVFTQDGSISCLDPETGELCHNRAGAKSEALQMYVKPSEVLPKLLKIGHIRLLDACYGLGYNTWVLLADILEALSKTEPVQPLTFEVVGVERSSDILDFLPLVLEHLNLDDLKFKIAPSEHNTYYRTLNMVFKNYIRSNGSPSLNFRLELWVEDLRKKVPSLEQDFDLVFHDAFSPQKMPELWTVELFREYYRLLNKREGRLLTYSSAGAVRGGLMEAGFQVGKTRGLGTKDSGTIAFASHDCVQDWKSHMVYGAPLDEWEKTYIESRAGLPYRDQDLSQSRENIISARKQEQEHSSRLPGKKRVQPNLSN